MCGICGFYSKRFDSEKTQMMTGVINSMTNAIQHRGPDEDGHYISSHGAALGHRRLSIIDISNGKQPFLDSSGNNVLVFNGEIYNFKEIRTELLCHGFNFNTNSDTEVLLQAYRYWGSSCVDHLRGMFAFAIWDDNKKTLFCARDHVGIKPFYYYWDNHTFVFASEIKSILQFPWLTTVIDEPSLVEYMKYQYIPSPETIYKDIYKLPAAHTLEFNGDEVITKKYWEIPIDHDDENFIESVYMSELESELENSVSYQMESDVPLGAFLSGGVDSSAVVSMMAKLSKNKINTNTAYFSASAHDESEHARYLADFLSTSHVESKIDFNIADDIDKILWHMDEPFADPSSIPTYYLCRETVKRVKVSLSGDGGDELFAGYNWYQELFDLRKFNPNSAFSSAIGGSAKLLPPNFKGVQRLRNIGKNPIDQHANLLTAFDVSELSRYLNIDMQHIQKKSLHHRIYEGLQLNGDDYIKAAQLADFNSYLVDEVLMKVDKMSMANSLEVRVPLLDHKFVEMAFKAPSTLNFSVSGRKAILKNMISDMLPPGYLDRPKQGFTAPVDDWLRNDLNEMFVDTFFTTNNVSGVVNKKEIEKLWKKFHKNRSYHSGIVLRLWILFCFERWYKIFI
jgi:asparagine synthase (glutamine-hydrolysing)